MSVKYRLDDVCDISMGQAPAGDAYNDVGDGWPLIAGAGDFGDLYPAPKKFTREASRISKIGDIVVGIRASIGEKVLSDGEYCLGRGVAGLRAGKNLESRFLWHWLTQITPTLMGKARGATFLQVNKGDIGELEIELPSLEEQRRIAAILDQAETLRAQRRQALAQLDSLTQSLFLDMFGDPVANPMEWERVPLTNACDSPDDIRCGPFGTQLLRSEFKTEGVPLWGIKNVNARFELATHEFVDERTAKRLSQYSIEPLDIVMTRKGTVGNCAVYPDSFPVGVMHSDLLRLRVSPRLCHSAFLSHQLHYSQDVAWQMSLISGGAVMPGINVSRLKSLLILLPPLPLQQTFATRIQAIEALKASHRAALAQLDALFTSLQQRAFAGEL